MIDSGAFKQIKLALALVFVSSLSFSSFLFFFLPSCLHCFLYLRLCAKDVAWGTSSKPSSVLRLSYLNVLGAQVTTNKMVMSYISQRYGIEMTPERKSLIKAAVSCHAMAAHGSV